jgi:hypothetical protein
MKVVLIVLLGVLFTSQSFAGNSKINKKRTVRVVFDESEKPMDSVHNNLTQEQIEQGGQLAANARRDIRLSNELNAPIPEDEAKDLFDVSDTVNN